MCLTHLALALVLYYFTGGREISSDAPMFVYLVEHPFDLLMGDTHREAQHPPLLPVMLWLSAAPLRLVLPDFLALRLSFILWEGVMAAGVVALVSTLGITLTVRRVVTAVLVLAPVGWMTSSVMLQDEVVAATFMVGAFLCRARGREVEAALLMALGVVAGKIFLLVPLLALVLTSRRWLGAGGAAASLIGGVYLWLGVMSQLRGGPPPLVGFSPGADFASSMWVWGVALWELDGATTRRWSAVLALLGALFPLLWWWRGGARRDIVGVSSVAGAMLSFVFLLFYHVNPEYYVMLIPCLLPAALTAIPALRLTVLTSLPWAVNFFFGVGHAASSGADSGKGAFVKVYRAVFPVEPEVMYHLSLVLCVVGTAWLAWDSTQRAGMCPPDKTKVGT